MTLTEELPASLCYYILTERGKTWISVWLLCRGREKRFKGEGVTSDTRTTYHDKSLKRVRVGVHL